MSTALIPASIPAATHRLAPDGVKTFVKEFCFDCHDHESAKAGLDLQQIVGEDLLTHSGQWESVIRKLQAHQMPPPGKKRSHPSVMEDVVRQLVAPLDANARKRPNPGRTDSLRRMNRQEYRNAVRDLLELDVDVTTWLPKDDASHGFDNVTVGSLSPTLLSRYLSAAEKISRLAIASPLPRPGGEVFRLKPDLTQEDHVEGLPPGTRGGAVFRHHFSRDGDYDIQVRLCRDRNEEVEGLYDSHDLEILLDRIPVKTFTVHPPKDRNFESVDAHLSLRIPISAGPHTVGVTFHKKPGSLLEIRRQPYQARFNMHRHPRQNPAVFQVSISGPFDSTGPGDTPSRRRIFICRPASPEQHTACAEKIVRSLARRAFRRPVGSEDLARPLQLFHEAAESKGFDAGIEAALASILASPDFLIRIEKDPPGMAAGTVYEVDDVELASRLSFFLWSSIPDDELLSLAEQKELHRPRTLERQTRRMLADPRALNLVTNFGHQWLHLRNLESIQPDLRLFPDFDDNLRQAFVQETDLHLASILKNDQSILDLIRANHTFLNERLARHYGIAGVQGSRFRKVALSPRDRRGGLLRQGRILTLTSYATRTSPVLRGNWILGTLLGTPPPPPPPDVPALKDNTVSKSVSVRQRLAEHRANPACASCHQLMDPVGFTLENYDAVGRWRTHEEDELIQPTGGFADGSEFAGVEGIEQALLSRPGQFAGAFAEKLLVFALGRGISPDDAPAIRKIVQTAKSSDYRMSSLIVGVVQSAPFTLRKMP